MKRNISWCTNVLHILCTFLISFFINFYFSSSKASLACSLHAKVYITLKQKHQTRMGRYGSMHFNKEYLRSNAMHVELMDNTCHEIRTAKIPCQHIDWLHNINYQVHKTLYWNHMAGNIILAKHHLVVFI